MIREWAGEWICTVVDNCSISIFTNIVAVLLVPGSGGSRPGSIVWSTCDSSGRAMVRVLGHRCSIVVWNFWSPYFRVKAAWLKFSSFDKFWQSFRDSDSITVVPWLLVRSPLVDSRLLCGTTRLPLITVWQVRDVYLIHRFNDHRRYMWYLHCHSLLCIQWRSIVPNSLILGWINLLEPIDHRLTIICTGITEGNSDALSW